MELATIERIGAAVAGVIVGVVAFHALYKDWKTPGVDNQVFKLMLLLLGVGAVLAILAAAGVVGSFPKAA